MLGGGMSDEGLTIAQLWLDGEVEQPRARASQLVTFHGSPTLA
jgi:hypothetical protein